jgi:hypothetical protein
MLSCKGNATAHKANKQIANTTAGAGDQGFYSAGTGDHPMLSTDFLFEVVTSLGFVFSHFGKHSITSS